MTISINCLLLLSSFLLLWQLGELITRWMILSSRSRRSKRRLQSLKPLPSRQTKKSDTELQGSKASTKLNKGAIAFHLWLAILLIGSAARFAFAQVEFSSKDECEAHYNACTTTLYQYVARDQEAEASLWRAICDVNKSWSADNALWKPVSESTGRPVLLLPASYLGAVIELYSPTGIKVAVGNDRGYLANGNRAHFDISTKNLPFETRVLIKNGPDTECRYLLDPSKRYE